MIGLIVVECRKLRGSLVLLPMVLAPLLPGLISALALLGGQRTPDWSSVFGAFAIPVWAMFLMPMTVATVATLLAQIEHRARGWDHLLALPVARWRIFAAKLAVALAIGLVMTGVVLAGAWLGAAVGGVVVGGAPTGSIPWQRLTEVVPMLLACTALLTVIQLWAALRFSNFVIPLGIGIGGTLVALSIAITHADHAGWFPWVLPLTGLQTSDPVGFTIKVLIPVAIAMPAMILHLAKRSFR